MTRVCTDCPAPISRSSRGRCRPCSAAALNADVGLKDRRAAGLRAYYDEGGGREAAAKRIRAYNLNLDEAARERRREHGRRQYREYLNAPATRALSGGAEARQQAVATRLATLYAWCPLELRDEYRRLIRTKRMSAAEARRVIEADIAGTVEHARRSVANAIDAQRIRHERDRAQAY